MLLWKILLCLFSANFVASEFASPELLVGDDPGTPSQPSEPHFVRGLLMAREVSPEILVDYDPGTTLQPPKGGLDAKDPSENRHFIRGLLVTRVVCPTGYSQCGDGSSKSVFSFNLSLR